MTSRRNRGRLEAYAAASQRRESALRRDLAVACAVAGGPWSDEATALLLCPWEPSIVPEACEVAAILLADDGLDGLATPTVGADDEAPAYPRGGPPRGTREVPRLEA